MDALMIGLLVFTTVFAGTLVLFRRVPAREAVAERLQQIEQTRMPRSMTLAMPFHQRALLPFAKSLTMLATRLAPPRSIEAVRNNLIKAGHRNVDPVVWILGKWALGGILAGTAFLGGLILKLPLASQPIVVIALGGFGHIWSELNIRRAILRRQGLILRELPETLDLLTISVEAGLGLDQALEVVTRRCTGPLSEEIRLYLEEVKLGKDRNEALKAIGKRTGLDELVSFTSSLVQAMEFGVSIASVLRIQADEVRTRRRQRIEERAMKAPVKMLFPIIFLILPAIFVVVAGPGLIRAYTEFIRPIGPGQFAPPGQ